MLKQQIQHSPVGTTVNVGPGWDVATWLATDEYVDVLDSVHLAGILQDKDIWAWTRHTKTELELRLQDRSYKVVLFHFNELQ